MRSGSLKCIAIISTMWALVADAVWFILPAYVANSAAVDVSGIPFLRKYAAPVDAGKTLNGKRILGDGKTWRGLIGGVAIGTLVGIIQTQTQSSLPPILPTMTIKLAFLLAFGALFGDMAASFFKRQTGLARGAAVPLLDQLDYVIFAFIFATLASPFIMKRFIIVVIITLPLHVFANYVAYKLKLKEVWW